MNTWLVVLLDLAINHYVFSFQRFTLQIARNGSSGIPMTEAQTRLTPAWMGLLGWANYLTLALSIYLLWTNEPWMWVVGYLAFRFLGSAFLPLLPLGNHFGKLATSARTSNA